MAITLPITSRTSSDDNDFADVYANDVQLVTEIDARDDNYQTIFSAQCVTTLDMAAGTYSVTNHGTAPVLSGGASNATPTFYFDDADLSISSKTTKLRLRAQVNANATAWSSVTATFGLYPVTFAGGADSLTVTLGTVVSGSTVALANPSASSTNQGNSGDFTIPADGQYAIGVVTSAQLTNNAHAQLGAQLQVRWV